MPTRKTVEANVVSAEPKKRSPRAPAATHKRSTKKTAESAILASEPVRSISHEEISRLAYSYWEARGYQTGAADEDWFRAERELTELAQNR